MILRENKAKKLLNTAYKTNEQLKYKKSGLVKLLLSVNNGESSVYRIQSRNTLDTVNMKYLGVFDKENPIKSDLGYFKGSRLLIIVFNEYDGRNSYIITSKACVEAIRASNATKTKTMAKITAKASEKGYLKRNDLSISRAEFKLLKGLNNHSNAVYETFDEVNDLEEHNSEFLTQKESLEDYLDEIEHCTIYRD